MRFASLHSGQHWLYFRPFYSTITKPESRKSDSVLRHMCIISWRVHLSSHLSKERKDSLVTSPMLPRKDGGSRFGSTVTSSDGWLTRLRRISFTFFPFESAGREGLTSDDKVDRASEMASGPWVMPLDDRSPSLAAVEVWSSPMPESYRRMDTPFSTSPEIVLLSEIQRRGNVIKLHKMEKGIRVIRNVRETKRALHFQRRGSLQLRMDTCAPGRLWPLRVFLVIVGLQDVAVLGHHEDRDEVNDSKSQKLSLLTVLLKQTKSTKRPGSLWLRYECWGELLNAARGWLLCSTHNISEDNSPEAVDVHVLKKPVQISHWRHSTCHCVNRTLHVLKSPIS